MPTVPYAAPISAWPGNWTVKDEPADPTRKVPGGIVATDVIVLIGNNHDSNTKTITAVSGGGATWTTGSTGYSVWAVGVNPTPAAQVNVQATFGGGGGTGASIFLVRGLSTPVAPSIATVWQDSGNSVAGPAFTVQAGQALLTDGHLVGGTKSLAGTSTPAGAWTFVSQSGDEGTAYAVPTASAGTVHRADWQSTSPFFRRVVTTMRVGSPAPPPPPGPPTALAATPGPDTVDLTWTAPTGGATGYDVRANGGAPTAVGNVTAYTLTGLTPATAYTLEVRATGPGGVSAWVPVSTTTLVGAAYRVVVRLGSHTWDVLAGDPPAYGPILPLSFGWQVPEDSPGFPAQPDPETLALELLTEAAADMSGVDIGTPVRVSIYTSSATTARPLATFVGRVGDLEASPTDAGGLRWRILGVDYTVDLAGRQVGAGDWPEESGDARAARIMAEAGFPGWTADPIGTTFEARGPQAVPASEELARSLAAAVTTTGPTSGPARRVLLRPRVDAAGNLDPAAPFTGSEVIRRTDHLDYVDAGFVNRRTTWRRTRLLDAGQVTIDHPGGPTLYGDPRLPAYPPQSLPITDPQEYADLILDTTPGFRWLTGDALRLELWAAEADARPLDWFYRDPASPPFPWSGRAVIVRRIAQAPDGSTSYAGMLAGARLILEPGGRLVVEFRLRPEIPADSTVTMRWMDEPAGATWADELAADPTGTWYAYRTTPRP